MRLRWWICLAGLYLLLAWSLAPAELVVAAVAATIGTAGGALVDAHARLPLRRAWRPLLGLFTDLVPLAQALASRRGGSFERVKLTDSSEAEAEALGSLSPASFVVRIDSGEVVVHRL